MAASSDVVSFWACFIGRCARSAERSSAGGRGEASVVVTVECLRLSKNILVGVGWFVEWQSEAAEKNRINDRTMMT